MLNIPAGYKLVPIEPTETMVVCGFESRPDPVFSKPEDWEAFVALTGCQQAAHKARLCYAAMLDAAPTPPSVAPGDAQDAVIAGALFDLMGFLTTLDEPVALGSTEEAAIAVELLQRWAAERGLNLDDADVKGWNERRTAPAAGDALDAARYRWLRHEGREEKHQDDGAIYVRQVQLTSGVITGSAVLVEEDLDAAIDAALAAQAPQQGEA